MIDDTLLERYQKFLELFHAPHTIRNYIYDLKLFLKFLEEKGIDELHKVDERLIYEYMISMKEKGNSEKSINRRIEALNKFFTYLFKQRIVNLNPCENIKRLKEKPRQIELLPEEKIEELKNRMEEPYKSIFIFLLNTGLRIGEFLALLDKPAKISSSNNALIITGKGNKIRQIPLNQTALECFLRVKEFHLEKKKLSYFKIWNKFQEYGIHPHMIRHTFATQLLKKGVDIGTLRDLLGHSNIRTTSIYIDLVNPEKIKIPEL